jgi:arylsulfatase A-like enzyme
MPIRCLSPFSFRRMLDSLAVVVSFTVAVHTAKIHAGFLSAPLLPELRELPLLFLLGIGWHLAARVLGLYDPSRSGNISGELMVLGKSTLLQLLGLAVLLFFVKSLTLNRFFALLYSAVLCGSTVTMRLIRRACGQVRRRHLKFLFTAGGAAILVAAAFILLLRPGPAPRPNIILISIDTLRADRLGCYGCPTETSPHIDAFSRESVQFMRAISQAPSTTSSHMSLFTGLLPAVHRVTNWVVLPGCTRTFKLSGRLGSDTPTLAQYLQENGYRTIGLHDDGHVSSIFGFDKGFNLYTNKLIKWGELGGDFSSFEHIRSQIRLGRSQTKPLFLFLHHYLCHDPYIKAPESIRRKYLPDPDPGLLIEPPTGDPGKNWKELTTAFWKAIDGDNPKHRRQVRDLYDAGVNYADQVFGEITSLLKKEGLYDQSLIAVVSDHGEEFWEHGNTRHSHLFVETLHVPLLIKFPGGMFGGRKIIPQVGLYDFMPTLLDYLRITPRLKLQAESLLPLIREEKISGSRVISFDDGLQFVRFSRGPFVYSNQGIRGGRGEWLFNRFADPNERHNLAANDLPLLAQMRSLAAKIMHDQQVLRARIKAGAPDTPALPEDLQRQLKALGYL